MLLASLTYVILSDGSIGGNQSGRHSVSLETSVYGMRPGWTSLHHPEAQQGPSARMGDCRGDSSSCPTPPPAEASLSGLCLRVSFLSISDVQCSSPTAVSTRLLLKRLISLILLSRPVLNLLLAPFDASPEHTYWKSFLPIYLLF